MAYKVLIFHLGHHMLLSSYIPLTLLSVSQFFHALFHLQKINIIFSNYYYAVTSALNNHVLQQSIQPFTKFQSNYVRSRTVTLSTWHEGIESTSFACRFVRLDPRRFLSSRSHVGTYHIILIINSFSETTFFKLLSATTRACIISSYFFLLYTCTFDT